MTQKEIVTALRICSSPKTTRNGCPLDGPDDGLNDATVCCFDLVPAQAADLIEAQQKKIDQLMADLMASVNGELGGKFTSGEAFKLTEYYKGEKCTMCKHFGGVKGKHLAEDLPEDHGKNCWKCNCNFEWVPPEERTE